MKKILFEAKRLARLAGINEATSSKPWAWERPIERSETSEADEKSAVLSIANALARRAMEMLDLDGEENNIEVRVDPNLFLSPYIDFDGHKGVVPPLAKHIYDNYVLGVAGDHDEKIADIINRIDVDYLDEDIQYALEALGDDRFTMPNTWNDDPEVVIDEDPRDKVRNQVHQYLIDKKFFKGSNRNGQPRIEIFWGPPEGSDVPEGAGRTNPARDFLKSAVESGDIDWATWEEIEPVWQEIDRSID